MSQTTFDDLRPVLRHELGALRGEWLWFVLVGVALIVLGVISISSAVIASLAVVVALGTLILLGGIVECVGAFWSQRWSGFFFMLLSGILAIVVGLMFLRAPVNALLALTMLVACFLLVEGVFKIVAALRYHFTSWIWVLVSGVIDVILGLLIWREWPEASLWVIGMFVGISMVFRGINWVALGLAFKSLPKTSTTSPQVPV